MTNDVEHLFMYLLAISKTQFWVGHTLCMLWSDSTVFPSPPLEILPVLGTQIGHCRQPLLDWQSKGRRCSVSLQTELCRQPGQMREKPLQIESVLPLSSLSHLFSACRGLKNCIEPECSWDDISQHLCKKCYNQYTWHKTDMMPWNWGSSLQSWCWSSPKVMHHAPSEWMGVLPTLTRVKRKVSVTGYSKGLALPKECILCISLTVSISTLCAEILVYPSSPETPIFKKLSPLGVWLPIQVTP